MDRGWRGRAGDPNGSRIPANTNATSRKKKKTKTPTPSRSYGPIPEPFLALAPSPVTSRPSSELYAAPVASSSTLVLPSTYTRPGQNSSPGPSTQVLRPLEGTSRRHAAGLLSPPAIMPGNQPSGLQVPPTCQRRRSAERVGRPIGWGEGRGRSEEYLRDVMSGNHSNTSLGQLGQIVENDNQASAPAQRRRRRIVRDDGGLSRRPTVTSREEGRAIGLARGASMRRFNVWDDVPEAEDPPPPFPFPTTSTNRLPPTFSPEEPPITEPSTSTSVAQPDPTTAERPRSPPPSFEQAIREASPSAVPNLPLTTSTQEDEGCVSTLVNETSPNLPSGPPELIVSQVDDSQASSRSSSPESEYLSAIGSVTALSLDDVPMTVEEREDRKLWNADILAGYTLEERVFREMARRRSVEDASMPRGEHGSPPLPVAQADRSGQATPMPPTTDQPQAVDEREELERPSTQTSASPGTSSSPAGPANDSPEPPAVAVNDDMLPVSSPPEAHSQDVVRAHGPESIPLTSSSTTPTPTPLPTHQISTPELSLPDLPSPLVITPTSFVLPRRPLFSTAGSEVSPNITQNQLPLSHLGQTSDSSSQLFEPSRDVPHSTSSARSSSAARPFASDGQVVGIRLIYDRPRPAESSKSVVREPTLPPHREAAMKRRNLPLGPFRPSDTPLDSSDEVNGETSSTRGPLIDFSDTQQETSMVHDPSLVGLASSSLDLLHLLEDDRPSGVATSSHLQEPPSVSSRIAGKRRPPPPPPLRTNRSEEVPVTRKPSIISTADSPITPRPVQKSTPSPQTSSIAGAPTLPTRRPPPQPPRPSDSHSGTSRPPAPSPPPAFVPRPQLHSAISGTSSVSALSDKPSTPKLPITWTSSNPLTRSLARPKGPRPPPVPPRPRGWNRSVVVQGDQPSSSEETVSPDRRRPLGDRTNSENPLGSTGEFSPSLPRSRSEMNIPARGVRSGSMEYTDLDVFVARLEGSGREYEGFSQIINFLGPAMKPEATPEALSTLLPGLINVDSRRITREGKVKLKLSLLGARVSKCPICLAQFRANEKGVLLPLCGHVAHETCAERWFREDDRCFVCRQKLKEEGEI
ncbi:hypothetical protein M231_00966 [Tremella mesenterica]|uniref:RING-type domain-containing protein n=1 Tax=Tremella mesenterica TaxID=5217 RepID=A0A4Q1BUE7_TREME|nr:hypothetical protein M231_00966 [Tremella mesenterica]